MKKKNCYRCGANEKDLRKRGMYYPCKVYSTYYGKHLFSIRELNKYCIDCGVLKIEKNTYSRSKKDSKFRNRCIKCYAKHGKKLRDNVEDRIKHLGIKLGTRDRFGEELAAKIYKKYNYKCSKCKTDKKLLIHHIDGIGRNYEEKGLKANNNENNLILVCRSCHNKIHGFLKIYNKQRRKVK